MTPYKTSFSNESIIYKLSSPRLKQVFQPDDTILEKTALSARLLSHSDGAEVQDGLKIQVFGLLA